LAGLADEHIPALWNVTIHLTGGLPMGLAKDLDTAKAEFKAAWEALKAGTTPALPQARPRGAALRLRHAGGRRLRHCRCARPTWRSLLRGRAEGIFVAPFE